MRINFYLGVKYVYKENKHLMWSYVTETNLKCIILHGRPDNFITSKKNAFPPVQIFKIFHNI